MEKILIINEEKKGTVKSYWQDRERGAWVFDLGKFEITVKFEAIRSFNSLLDLEIITF